MARPDDPDDLARLRALIASDPRVAEGLDDYCLLVDDAESFGGPDAWADAPPRLGEAFARDGTEHEFCLLDDGAVLLYTPLSDTPYVVVGADLREFLCLLLHGNGAQIGGLGYDLDEAAEELSGSAYDDEDLSDGEREALVVLTAAFALEPWPDVASRVRELAARRPDPGGAA